MLLIRIAFPQDSTNMKSLEKLRNFLRNRLFILTVICYTVHGADPFCMAMNCCYFIIPYAGVCIFLFFQKSYDFCFSLSFCISCYFIKNVQFLISAKFELYSFYPILSRNSLISREFWIIIINFLLFLQIYDTIVIILSVSVNDGGGYPRLWGKY